MQQSENTPPVDETKAEKEDSNENERQRPPRNEQPKAKKIAMNQEEFPDL